MTHCENCGISDSDKEVRLSDTAPSTWVCKDCHELNPHHSNWYWLKQRPYNELHSININFEMNREAIEHVIEVLRNSLYDEDGVASADLENKSFPDVDGLADLLEQSLDGEALHLGEEEDE